MADSCDTFVALPSVTAKGCVIFGKNSDRPASEVQEVVYNSAKDHGSDATLQCTYIEIPQAEHTHAVILSKPAWMWGAEMGANEHGVSIGNEAVWTKLQGPEDAEEKLLGMDLVRLGLERGSTAKEAMDVITSLLQEHGQGGICFEDPERHKILYHNSFIIADGKEAWVLETAAKEWAAEKLTTGTRNISNLLSIHTQIDAMSSGLKETAQTKGYWKPDDGDLDFAKVYSGEAPSGCASGQESPENRFAGGKALLEKLSADNQLSVTSMFSILRDEASGICRSNKTGSATTGSMVSALFPPDSPIPSCHWFTATPNPSCSVFKPFIFCPDVNLGQLTKSPDFGDEDPAKVQPRFQKQVDRRHPLYKAHETINPLPGSGANKATLGILGEMESQCVEDIQEYLSDFDKNKTEELRELFKDVVESEVKFYNSK